MKIEIVSVPERATKSELPIYSSHLDVIRGLAALVVMVGHLKFRVGGIALHLKEATGWTNTAPVRPPNYMVPPHQAVLVFFVLSGVLVGGSVLREQVSGSFSWTRYAIKRLSRLLVVLVPALTFGFVFDWISRYLLSLGGAATSGMAGDVSNLNWATFWGNICFLQTLDRTNIASFGSNTALWSLAFEFWYYVLFAVLAAVIFSRGGSRRGAYGVATLLLGYFLWKEPLLGFSVWSMGALVSRMPLVIPRRFQHAAVIPMAFQFAGCSIFLYRHPLASHLLNDWLLGLSFTALVFAILHRREKRPKTLYAELAEHLARPSYTLYLFHMPILTLLGAWIALHAPTLTSHKWPAVVLLGLLTYAICYAFYLVFERNTDKVRHAVERQLMKRSAW
jgi:peptidoglycan/LPS O-acetylase OafA/YrhL